MLHFEYPLCVCLFLFPLVLSVAGGGCLIPVGEGVGVEDSYIKKCLLHHGLCVYSKSLVENIGINKISTIMEYLKNFHRYVLHVPEYRL